MGLGELHLLIGLQSENVPRLKRSMLVRDLSRQECFQLFRSDRVLSLIELGAFLEERYRFIVDL